MRRPFFMVFLILSLLFACDENDKIAEEISKINVDLKVSRFDREFAEAKTEDLPRLKQKYPYLFPEQYADSVWTAKLSDTIQIELSDEVQKGFPDFSVQSAELTSLFQHVKYYFPQIPTPNVVTLTSDVQYGNRVVLADTLLLIGLDNYLGENHHFYVDIPKYVAKELDKQFLTGDVAGELAAKMVPRQKDRAFLARMIYHGKKLYVKDKLMPNATDAQKIGYTQNQFDWAVANEEPMWRNFIENEYLFSTDSNLASRFLDPAPFSKFGLELVDNESPGRIGQYLGWQIVRAFMNNNELTVQELLNQPAEEIFKKANYKPQK